MEQAIQYYKTQGGLDSNNIIIRDAFNTPIISINKTADLFNINKMALRRRLTGELKLVNPGRPTYLSTNEVRLLVDLAKFRALSGCGVTQSEFQKLARDYKQSLNPGMTEVPLPTFTWVKSVMDKYKPEIGLRNSQTLAQCRIKSMTREKLDDFYAQLDEVLDKTNLNIYNEHQKQVLANIIYNCDETGISLKPKSVKIIMPRGYRNAFSVPVKDIYDYTTVMGCGNANGDVLNPMIIYRNVGDTVPSNYMSWDGPLYRTTKSGWINSQLFIEWFTSIFIPESRAFRPTDYEGPIILIFDGHTSHISLDVIKIAKENNIIFLKLPSHSTHVLQPLDLNFFGPLKAVLAKIIREKTTDSEKPVLDKENFAEILHESWQRISRSWLKKGFELSGIFSQEFGINKQAIIDSQLKIALPFNEHGFIFLQTSKAELEELQFPEDLTEFEIIRKRFIEVLERKPPSNKKPITDQMRKKRGSGLAIDLTKTPPKPALDPNVKSALRAKDPINLTPGKSPPHKKTSAKIKPRKSGLEYFESVCQICLTKGSSSSILWVQCSGGCERWLHHKCVTELKNMSKVQAQIHLEAIDLFCSFCKEYGPFNKRSKFDVN